MTYSSKALTMTLAIVYAHAYSMLVHADIWDEKTSMNGGVIRMVTTCVPQYFARRGRGNGRGYVGDFVFGKEVRRIQGRRCAAQDGSLPCIVMRRKMDNGEYRNFSNMSLFFSKERCLLYKVIVEQVFPRESMAKDRMMVINGIIEDCKRNLELLPVRTAVSDARKVYQCADDDFEVVIELRKEPDGSHRLLLSIANKKVRDGRMYEPNQVAPAFNADTDVDVAI